MQVSRDVNTAVKLRAVIKYQTAEEFEDDMSKVPTEITSSNVEE